ncbi:MAG: DoxX family protein [Pyrinomonadaceae bacterium]
MFRRILFGSDINGTALATLGLTLLRMFAGIGLITHGLSKLPPSEKFIAGVAQIGFPLASLFAWAASLSEFAGGALLLVGLLTRPAAFFILFTMCTAIFGVHFKASFGEKELALLYGFIALGFMLMGAGDWSVDALLRNNKRRR